MTVEKEAGDVGEIDCSFVSSLHCSEIREGIKSPIRSPLHSRSNKRPRDTYWIQQRARMAAMVIKTPQFSLPTSNGHTVNETEELEKTPASVPQFHIDVGELQKSCNDACNQLTPRKARAAAEIPKNIFSSFKTALMFGANGPDAQGGTLELGGIALSSCYI